MIARIWHGATPTTKAEDYQAFLRQRAIPDYGATPGNLAACVLRREEGDITHFLTLTHWTSLQAIAAFAGDDITRAKYYAEDKDFLLAFEPAVQHYVVADVASSLQPGSIAGALHGHPQSREPRAAYRPHGVSEVDATPLSPFR